MNTRITIFTGAFLLATIAASPAEAQTPADRRVMAVSVQHPAGGPAGGGPTAQTVRAYVTAEALPTAGTVDLSMRVQFRLNGTTFSEQIINAQASPGGPTNPCGEFPCELGEVCYCHGSPPECDCGFWIGVAEEEIPAAPGDEIMVILFPAPGAAPESDPSNDMKLTQYQGEEIFWDRSVRRVRVVPAPAQGGPANAAGDSFFCVWTEIDIAARYDGALEIPLELELLVNGASHSTTNFPDVPDTITYASCTPSFDCDQSVCTTTELPSLCTTSADHAGCVCYYQSAFAPSFFDIPLMPGDVIEVILRPVPGALPELPGFPENDDGETIVCPGDTNGDGQVNIDDVVNVVLDFGTDGAAHGGDVDDGSLTGTPDGTVNIDDIVFVILHFGDLCIGPM